MNSTRTPKTLAAILMALAVVVLPLSGCAGRTARPIATMHPGDKNMACDQIEAEMYDLDTRARRLMAKHDYTTEKNRILGAAGLFLFFPWFFRDLSYADRHEAKAMQDRGRHLLRIYNRKNCEEEDS